MYTSALPSYGGPGSGDDYWNTRCDMNYKSDDWLDVGYWHGSRKYTRSRSSTTNCPCNPCSNGELDCRKFGNTALYV